MDFLHVQLSCFWVRHVVNDWDTKRRDYVSGQNSRPTTMCITTEAMAVVKLFKQVQTTSTCCVDTSRSSGNIIFLRSELGMKWPHRVTGL